MKSKNKPSLAEWKELYELAVKFEKLAPWEWVFDTDVFGVQNPETDEIGYCVTMGRNKEFYGFAIYQGAEGFDILDKIASGYYVGEDAKYVQKCLMMSFDKRDYLEKGEMDIIKEIGVRFDNRNFWPQFRDYSPGYYPWYISQAQARYLIIALQQALELLPKVKEDQEMLAIQASNKFLIRLANKKDGKINWTSKHLPPDVIRDKESIPEISEENEVLVRRIKKNIPVHGQMIWELDYFYFGEPLRDKEDDESRPYFPKLLLIVENFSGAVMSACLSEPSMVRVVNFRKAFLEAIIKHKIIPQKLHIRNSELAEMLFPLVKFLGIEIVMTNELNMFDEAKDSFNRDVKFRKIVDN